MGGGRGAEPLPIWRRRKWLLVGLGVVVLLAFLFTRGKPQHAQDAQKGDEPYIGVVVPYQPPKAEAPPLITAHEHRRHPHQSRRRRRQRCRPFVASCRSVR